MARLLSITKVNKYIEQGKGYIVGKDAKPLGLGLTFTKW